MSSRATKRHRLGLVAGAALFLDEPIKVTQVIGGAIVIVALVAVIRRDLQLAALDSTSVG